MNPFNFSSVLIKSVVSLSGGALFLASTFVNIVQAQVVPASATQAEASASADVPIELTTPTGALFGSLLLPAQLHASSSIVSMASVAPILPMPPVPLVIFHAGSGPTDRDGNSAAAGKNDSLKMLAVALAENGIASLRYDKRGVAKSAAAATAEKDLRFDTYVDDLAGWSVKLREDKRFNKIIIAGHSEGSLIGMIAARKAKADGFISLAGIARGAADVLRTQLKPNLPPALWEESERVLKSLEAGKLVDNPPPALASLYRASAQPYLISWFSKSPTAELAKLNVPILIVQGTTDIQVDVKEAEALKRAAPKAELIIIDGMNHIFKSVEMNREKNIKTYSDPSIPLSATLLPPMVKFILAIK